MFNFESIHWGNAGMWWLLLLPLVMIPAWISYEVFHRKVSRAFSGASLLPGMLGGPGSGRRLATFICVFLALEMFSVAALRPKYGLKDVTVKGTGVDVAIVLDSSRSMKTTDVKPDRMGISTLTISKMLEQAAGNRFSLVPFAGIAFIQSPLTVDYGIIRQYMNDLRVTDMPVPGTALGRALATAGRSLGVGVDGFRGSAGKAIIVFTDGENHEGEPEAIAKELAAKGVRIFTVGVGTPEGMPLPELDEKGVVTGISAGEDGESPIISRLDEDLLRKLADATQGRYYSLSTITSSATVADALAGDIDGLMREEYLTAVERLLEERFQYPLGAGIVLMLLPFLWLGGGRRKIAGAAVGLIILCSAPATAAEPFEHPVLATLFNRNQPDVKAAVRMLNEGRYGDALKALQEVAAKHPPAPAIDYNIAVAAMKAGELDTAAQAIDKAIALNKTLPLQSPQRLRDSRLNATRGSIHVEKARKTVKEGGSLRDALPSYRQALDSFKTALLLEPDNADIRRALEIVSMAAFPACSSLDDEYESNDTQGAAGVLTPDQQTGLIQPRLLLCPDNEDWFAIDLRPGETLALSAVKPAAAQPDEQAAQAAGQQQPPADEPAPVDVRLTSADGLELAGPGKAMRHTSTGEQPQRVFVQVTGTSPDDGTEYVLKAVLIPSCRAGGDDRLEDNDTLGSAAEVQDGDLDLRICQLDDDFFTYTLPEKTARKVTLSFETGEGPLELAVIGADGTPVAVNTELTEAGQVKTAELPESEAATTWTLAVAGGGFEGFYRLSISESEGDGNGGGQDDKQQDQEQEPQPQDKPAGSQAIRQLVDELDSNRENLDAQEARRNSAIGDHAPDKDW